MTALLEIRDVRAGYAESGDVLRGIDLDLHEGEVVALLGRNGVGKTTLLLTLMGITRLHRGQIAWRGEDLTALPTYRRAHAGIGWVPQERHVFPSLTVAEHLSVAARPGPWTIERVYRTFPRLEERRGHYGTQLSGGERQMLAIGTALMCGPELLLVDELSLGLAPLVMEELGRALRTIRDRLDTTLLLVEQNAQVALGLADYGYVMENGRIVLDGTPERLRAHEDIREFYLGAGSGERRRNYRDVKQYRRSRRWYG